MWNSYWKHRNCSRSWNGVTERHLTVSLKLRREESDLEWEIKNLLSSIKNSKASSVVFEIDNEFKHTLSPLDLENLLIKK